MYTDIYINTIQATTLRYVNISGLKKPENLSSYFCRSKTRGFLFLQRKKKLFSLNNNYIELEGSTGVILLTF